MGDGGRSGDPFQASNRTDVGINGIHGKELIYMQGGLAFCFQRGFWG